MEQFLLVTLLSTLLIIALISARLELLAWNSFGSTNRAMVAHRLVTLLNMILIIALTFMQRLRTA